MNRAMVRTTLNRNRPRKAVRKKNRAQ
jgi:hypothetical protein